MQEIIACMAENGDYSQTELDEFCSIFFESIEAGLLADKYVKIKGFGTFKLINVSDRESINVNTGERIQISGHAKASFIPDNDLKDLINSPFSHFQTVAINDETNLEEMSSIADDDILEMEQALETEETDGEQTPLIESSDEEMPEKEDLSLLSQGVAKSVVQQGNAATAQSKVASPEPSASLDDGLGQDCVDNADSDVSSNEAVGTEVTESSNRHVASDEEGCGLPFDKEKESTDDNAEKAKDSASVSQSGEPADAAFHHASDARRADCESDNANQEEGYYSSVSHTTGKPYPFRYVLKVTRAMQRPNWWKVIAIFLFVSILLALSYFAGYYKVFCPPCEEGSDASQVVNVHQHNTDTAANAAKAAEGDSAKVVQEDKKDSVAAMHNANVSAKENVEAPQQDSAKKEELPVSYSLKKKYSISGLQSIHKVKTNETLSMIARRIYGHKEFSKYIVQYNNISNPDNIVVGTALRIPALKEKQN
uniref:HU family DNA-binding protein n=1 Tax=Alloprevotella sp. TaxID=1872471 RepID=UPI004028A03B